MTDTTTAYDRRISQLPAHWKGPSVDVLDSAETVLIACHTWGIPADPALVVGLTDLILKRRQRYEEH